MEPKIEYLSWHPYVGIIQIRFRVLSQLGFHQAPRAFVLINVRLKFIILYCPKLFYKGIFLYSSIILAVLYSGL